MVDGAEGQAKALSQSDRGLSLLMSPRQGLSDRHGDRMWHGEDLPGADRVKARARGEKSTNKIVCAKPHGQILCKRLWPVTGVHCGDSSGLRNSSHERYRTAR